MLVLLLRIADCTSLQPWHWGWAHSLHLVNLTHSGLSLSYSPFQNSTQSPGGHSQRNTQLEGKLRKKLEVVLHHRCPNPTTKTRKAHWGGNGRKNVATFLTNISKSSQVYSSCVSWGQHLNLVCFAFWSITWLVLMVSATPVSLQLLSARTHLWNALLK